jgi:hypothetical protein
MTSTQVFRVSGLALVIGAVTFIAHIVARSVITASAAGNTVVFATQSSWMPINALGAIGAALVLLGLPAMYAETADATDRWGLIGIVLIALGWMIVGLFLSLYSMLVLPWLVIHAPALIDALNQDTNLLIVFVSGQLAEFLGITLLAIPFVRGRAQPRWIGYLLAGSALMTIVGDLVAPNGPATSIAVNLFSNLGPVLLMSGFFGLGLQMWRKHPAAEQAASTGRRSAVRVNAGG